MGSKSTTTQSIPAYIEQGGMEGLELARAISQMGYVPYMGADVAAYNPMQQAAAQGAIDGASAFGIASPISAQMNIPTVNTNGVAGYSSYGGYQDAVARLQDAYPGLAGYLDSFSIDPVTGQARQAAGQATGQAGTSGQAGTNRAQGNLANFMSGGNLDLSKWYDPRHMAQVYANGRGMMENSRPTVTQTGNGTGAYGLPDPMNGGRVTGTNFGGAVGNVVNTITGLLG